MGEYTPVYAQWKYGKGRVGTFACDLNGVWSSDFLDNTTGQTILNNIIYALFPTDSVRSPDIEMEYEGNNYFTNLSIFTELEEDQYVEVTITSPPAQGESEGLVQVITAKANETYSRLSFVVKTSGIHEIRAVRKNADGSQSGAESVIYKELSYSQVEVQVPSNMPSPEELPLARKYAELHKAGKDDEIPFEGMMLTTVVATSLRQLRLEHGPEFFSLPVSALRIGDVAMIGLPGEPFTGIGLGLKETEGPAMVIPTCATNAYEGYFPMLDSYEGGYEAGSSNYKAGVAELFIEEGQKLLKSLWN